MQIAASLTGTRLVTAAVAFAAAFGLYRAWPDAETEDTVDQLRTPARTTYSYVPLLGDPTHAIQDSADRQGAGCAPFIAPLIAHPNWSLQIVDAASGCTGDWIHNTYEVFSDGSVFWQADGMPDRVLRLTRPELAMIARANDFPCGRTDPVGYSYNWLRIAPGGDRHGRGAGIVPTSSLAGGMLDAVMQGAIERYRTTRLAQIGPYEVDVRLAPEDGSFRITMNRAGRLVIRRGKREIVARQLAPAERADLFDYLVARVGTKYEPDLAGARGVLVAGGVRAPVALSRWIDPQVGVLWEVVADARELESPR